MTDLQATTTTGQETVLEEAAIQTFKDSLRGELLRPGDEDYEEARHVWNGMIDKHPALIARCTGVADVIAAVNFAREHELLVAVRGGGHSVAGHSTCDGGLVIDLSLMRSVRVDPKAGTARVEGGATWGDVDRETQLFGLATPGGVVSTTGVAGLTLGGGYGWLRRKYGLSCDNLLSADVVTADGRLLTASETEHADLLWGLKGGGGNFGIVTSFEFQLHPVGPEVMYAATMYPAEQAGKVLRAWRDYVATATKEVTSDATLWSVLPIPEFPTELHGRPIILVEGVYAGTVEDGTRILQSLRELDAPLLDLSGPLPYTALNSALDALLPAGAYHCYWKSLYLNDLSSEAIDAIVAWGVNRPSPMSLIPIRHLGGAMSRIGPQETAFGDRSAPFLLSIDSTWEDPGDTEQNIGWTRAFWADMQRFSGGATYFNFPGLLEEGEALLRKTFGANYERLVALKNKYDPANLFRLNQNIKPTA
jgi:FAD/FMN-containing dehydrogenase